MYEIAEQVRTWREAGEDVRIAQVVATRGFSSRDPSAAAAWIPDRPAVGSVLEGVDPQALVAHGPGLVELTIGDDEARASGLACGGTASVLVQSASQLPDEAWDELAARRPLLLVTHVPTGAVEVFTPTTIRSASLPEVPRLFARGTSATALLGEHAVVSLWPVPTLVVVGDGLIATALADIGAVLGWQTRAVDGADEAVAAAGALHHSDAFVVLSHDRAVDGPALAAALAGSAGYVGALGSRRTQAARGEWLTGHGVAAPAQERIHGPAGLDLDAHTPGEIAVSIVAEILAGRTQASGVALRDRPGPVHVAGVNAPPPRY